MKKFYKRLIIIGTLFLILLAPIFAETWVSEERQKLIDYGLTLQGTPYVWGGKRPETGLDCSGFVGYVAQQALEKNISGSAATMYSNLEHISPEEKEPGDLIFFAVKSGDSYKVTHVGIYLGLYHGEGKLDGEKIFLHSASDGRYTGVIVSSINDSYWKKYFYGYARFLDPTPVEENQKKTEEEKPEESQTPVPAAVTALPVAAETSSESTSSEIPLSQAEAVFGNPETKVEKKSEEAPEQISNE